MDNIRIKVAREKVESCERWLATVRFEYQNMILARMALEELKAARANLLKVIKEEVPIPQE